MLSIINLSTTATEESDRARALEQFHATSLHLMRDGKNAHVSVSVRDYADDELIVEEPDWEVKYDTLFAAITQTITAWSNSDTKYRQKMAYELQQILIEATD